MTDKRDPHDNYETPAEAVHQLLSNQRLNGSVIDPSCGRGKLMAALIEGGIDRSNVFGSDKYSHIISNMQGSKVRLGMDLLSLTKTTLNARNVVMNPPYSKADEHTRHMLQVVPSNGVLCVLLRLTWMAAKKRSDLLSHLSKIIMVGRLKMLPPEVKDKGFSGTVDFAWFVFVPRVVEATTIVRAK